MRFKSPLIAVASVGMLALSACGGSGSSSPGTVGGSNDPNANGGATGNAQDPTAKGPYVIPNAQKGGIVTVLTLGGLQLPQFLDPSTSYYTDTTSIESGLVTRSLTQYKYDPTSKQMVLVPDLATDLGQHNGAFTKWTFTIRSGVKFEDGTPVTAKNIVWGIQRCMDAKTWGDQSPCQPYANGYFRGGSTYKGPYTAPNQKFTAAKASGNKLTIFMDTPFPDMPYFGTFPAMGPIPLSKSASDPKTYLKHPMSTGPYMFKSYQPTKELVLTQNPNWDPNTDPARTQYPDGYDIKMQAPSERTDQILLADSGDGQTTLTYDDLLAPDYAKMQRTSPDRLTLGGQPCTFYIAPDNRKITNKKVREALSWAWPYKNYLLAKGLIEGVTAIPANNLMAPGVPGRKPYNVTGRKDFQTDPNKAKTLLQQANAMGYEIKFVYATDDPASVKGKDTIVKALTEAGFKATPVPSTVNKAPAVRDDVNADINIRSAGWCSDWPSGATWIPPLLANTDPSHSGTFGQNYAAFDNKSVDNQMGAIQKLPLAQQADAWNNLDKSIAKKYFPLFPTYYGGITEAHGSRIQGMSDDNTLGMPTWKDIWISQ
jgi:peptide/nickel transport system substrate-binding protein